MEWFAELGRDAECGIVGNCLTWDCYWVREKRLDIERCFFGEDIEFLQIVNVLHKALLSIKEPITRLCFRMLRDSLL